MADLLFKLCNTMFYFTWQQKRIKTKSMHVYKSTAHARLVQQTAQMLALGLIPKIARINSELKLR